jgi:hypothetical protein
MSLEAISAASSAPNKKSAPQKKTAKGGKGRGAGKKGGKGNTGGPVKSRGSFFAAAGRGRGGAKGGRGAGHGAARRERTFGNQRSSPYGASTVTSNPCSERHPCGSLTACASQMRIRRTVQLDDEDEDDFFDDDEEMEEEMEEEVPQRYPRSLDHPHARVDAQGIATLDAPSTPLTSPNQGGALHWHDGPGFQLRPRGHRG